MRACRRSRRSGPCLRGNEVVERAHGLLDGRGFVVEVEPVEVDVVGLESSEGVLALVDNGLSAHAAGVGVAPEHVARELGGDDCAVALRGVFADVVADDNLGVPLGVYVGGVEEVAARVEVDVHDLFGGFDVRAEVPVLAEGHCSEAEGGDAEAGVAERDVAFHVHVCFPRWSMTLRRIPVDAPLGWALFARGYGSGGCQEPGLTSRPPSPLMDMR